MTVHDPFTDDPFTEDPFGEPSIGAPSTSLSAMTSALASMLDEPPAESAEAGTRVDQIAVRKASGFVFLTPRQWSAIETEARMAAIKENRVVFLCDEAPVNVRTALRWLKANPNGASS